MRGHLVPKSQLQFVLKVHSLCQPPSPPTHILIANKLFEVWGYVHRPNPICSYESHI